ncbi:hypothetical protein CSKR_108707, partial [Clonorchis sinensis]
MAFMHATCACDHQVHLPKQLLKRSIYMVIRASSRRVDHYTHKYWHKEPWLTAIYLSPYNICLKMKPFQMEPPGLVKDNETVAEVEPFLTPYQWVDSNDQNLSRDDYKTDLIHECVISSGVTKCSGSKHVRVRLPVTTKIRISEPDHRASKSHRVRFGLDTNPTARG